jgi:hypothetical protein
MIVEGTIQSYIHRLVATVGKCSSIEPQDRADMHRQPLADGTTWLVGRGSPDARIRSWPDAATRPFGLIHGGVVHLYLRIRQVRIRSKSAVEVEAYQIRIEDLAKNPNALVALRYDKTAGLPKGQGWDDDLQDNPNHPYCHLHLNYTTPDANDLRLPTGHVSPLLLLAAFDHWYCSTYHSAHA